MNRLLPHDQLLKAEFDDNLDLLDLIKVLADLGYLGLVAYYDVPPPSLPHRSKQLESHRPPIEKLKTFSAHFLSRQQEDC